MNTDALESFLEGGCETERIEFKRAGNWDKDLLVKDILALSNVIDGGYIIVGVEDATFLRQGVTPAQKETYNIDIMRDQVSPYADPCVNFRVFTPKDKDGREFVVIRVYQFEELPVICKKDGRDIVAGRIYYRNSNRRVESGPISSSYDMRNIILAATVRMMQKMHQIGFTGATSFKEELNNELEGL